MTGTLITGGAGFVGTNMAHRLLTAGERVVVFDDLSRPAVRHNLRWLQERHAGLLTVVEGPVTDRSLMRQALVGVRRVFHFAAQVAVTASILDPSHDFGVNLLGTVNLLEEIRRLEAPPALLYTSTNKVYGTLSDITLEKRAGRYEPTERHLRDHGIGEDRPLAFCSPYACSKGGADQYVLDFAATYGLPNVVFRMSCIYGPHQRGSEDQGWLAHFLMRAMAGQPITLYGDGCQVRDVLFIDDLLDAMLLATDQIERHAGRVFNIGGGIHHTLSLLELVDMISSLEGRRPVIEYGPWRVGDQKYYVSDNRSLHAAVGWTPKVGPEEGLHRLHGWLASAALRTTLTEAV